MKTILLRFSGPLQSWGTSSHFESRHTDLYPSKSAVIGMIAAAFGYRRSEDDKIGRLNRLHFAVRADQEGTITEDYQTAHKYKYNPDPVVERTYVTHRYYLEDAVFLVAIGHEDDQWMTEIEEALRHPYFQLYMGRRSCPVAADCVFDVVSQDVISALKKAAWQAEGWYKKMHHGPVYMYSDAALLPAERRSFRRDVVSSLAWSGRRYLLRQEGSSFIDVADDGNSHLEHDVFASI